MCQIVQKKLRANPQLEKICTDGVTRVTLFLHLCSEPAILDTKPAVYLGPNNLMNSSSHSNSIFFATTLSLCANSTIKLGGKCN